jgi:hypothetical protein
MAEDTEAGPELLTDVELVEMDSLIPYANNPKKHPEEQVDKIAASIRKYGFDQPIVIDAEGEIIKGHGRYQAARRLDLEVVPVIWRDGLTPAQVKGARLADNKTQMESGWNLSQLSVEFEELREFGTEAWEGTGFQEDEIESILDHEELDVDEFFEAAEEGEFVDEDNEDDEDGEGHEVPAGEMKCPECGHTFQPTVDQMGGEDADDAQDQDTSAQETPHNPAEQPARPELAELDGQED